MPARITNVRPEVPGRQDGDRRTCGGRSTAARLCGLPVVFLATFAAFPASATDDGASRSVAAAVEPSRSDAVHHPRENTFMKRQWGVEVLYVRQTAAGYMLEFRYRVLDPVKAAPLFERQIKPVLTHVESGATFVVPTPAKTGALRNSNPPLAGHTYWMFFANPGQYVKPGQHVDIAIGDFRVEGLLVQ